VRGACLDDAVDLLLAADLVVAFPSATFARARLRADAGGQRLSAAALDELFGRGDAIATERAVANGLVDLVVRSEEELDSRIASLAGTAGEEVRRVKRAARELAR
jgi:enoyl-CoA hydratase/carnithine racemase